MISLDGIIIKVGSSGYTTLYGMYPVAKHEFNKELSTMITIDKDKIEGTLTDVLLKVVDNMEDNYLYVTSIDPELDSGKFSPFWEDVDYSFILDNESLYLEIELVRIERIHNAWDIWYLKLGKDGSVWEKAGETYDLYRAIRIGSKIIYDLWSNILLYKEWEDKNEQ